MATQEQYVETPCHRRFFFVGGVYVEDTATHFGGYTLKDQTYVECLTPIGGARREFPIVLIHGGGQSGMNWLQTPDGRKGWASFFLDQGYELYLIDTASRGRSAMDLTQNYIQYPTGMAEDFWTCTKAAAKWAQAKLHNQWPGTGRRGDPVFDQYYATILPSAVDLVAYQQAQKDGVSALLKRIDRPSILLIHSQGAPGGWLAADAFPHLVKAIVAVEPNGPPFAGTHPHNGSAARSWGLTDIPMEFSPAISGPSELHLTTIPSTEDGKEAVVLQDESHGRTVHKLKNLESIPVLIEMGEASYHAGFDHATVAFLRQAGVSCDFIKLEDIGIHGNGHMQMLELNNLQIAAVLHRWIEDKLYT
ncbi:hypothetical protein LTR84_006045 [Exophiala bonariae]|uniref:AB hydrolase-1 domain-containing protein n=1 Tax=Exophiala bonariae TaxID=1690606 RepID=A0AAV9N3X3_9EURO|nr:hypothetical protein LTR84_006045 [Exophiala bonariae]